MQDEVWGGVDSWGLKDYSEGTRTISTDPVCGRRVDEAKAPAKTSYSGVTYYFCSKECQREFERAPAEYTGRVLGQAPQRVIDINTATPEDLRRIFDVNDDGLNQILQNRPYSNWFDFESKNPAIPEVVITSLKESGVVVSPHDLNRIR